jgi:hypothetical protein
MEFMGEVRTEHLDGNAYFRLLYDRLEGFWGYRGYLLPR